MNDELLALSKAAREVVVDTGCNWTDAAAKVLEGVRLTKETRDHLLAYGLAAVARNSLDRPKRTPAVAILSAEQLAAKALEPFVPYPSLVRVFQVNGGTSKRFLDCTIDDLSGLAESLKRKAAGLNATIRLAIDTRAEMQRVGADVVSALPPDILKRLDGNAPW